MKRKRITQSAALSLVLGMLVVFILVTGFVYYRYFKTEYLAAIQSNLSATSQIKITQIVQFREDRMAEAEVLATNAEVGIAVGTLLNSPQDGTALNHLSELFYPVVSTGHYNLVRLVDADGRQYFPSPTGGPLLSPGIVDDILTAISNGKISFTGLYLDPVTSLPEQSIIIPVLAGDNLHAFSALVLQMNLGTGFYPMLTAGSSLLNDIYLIELQGQGVQLLSPSHEQGIALLNEYIPLTQRANPAVKLATGKAGSNNGMINGVPVIASGSPVGDTGWLLLVTEPESRVMAPVQHMLWFVILFVIALLSGVAAAAFGSVLDTNEIRRKDIELREKNVEMQRFTYTVTHDLKSPVVTVKTFVNYLMQDIKQVAPAEQIEKDISYIRNAADRMGRLLDELLKMSRIGHQDNAPVKTDFHSLAQGAINAVAGQIAQAGVKVTIGDENVALIGDNSALLQLWQNLVENAVKYMGDQPSPEIVLGLERRAQNVTFFVRDNGMGIDMLFHEQIFGIFEKLDTKSDGTGLGLAVVKRIVEIYHGSVWVESPGIGKGSTFKFTIPDVIRL